VAAFEAEKNELAEILSPLAGPAIEHVGSTAVPGLAAKPIVDVAIGLRDASEVTQALALLSKHGRSYVKGANQPGMLFMARGEGDLRTAHYHLVVRGSPAWQKLIVFRDYLRRHPGAAAEYGALKTRLADQYPDTRAAYMDAKRSALRAIMQRGFAEDRRRRHANALRLELTMDGEIDALRAWWDQGHGRPPWGEARPTEVPAEPGPEPTLPEDQDLEEFDPRADA
jgi:GrpB-like predicted nucleotidyltransferase (UPF0157 family)